MKLKVLTVRSPMTTKSYGKRLKTMIAVYCIEKVRLLTASLKDSDCIAILGGSLFNSTRVGDKENVGVLNPLNLSESK